MVSMNSKTLNVKSLPTQKEVSARRPVQDLLRQVGQGQMSDVAYDTAWIARLGEIDWDISSRALAWLSEHQLQDGSWGAERPFYFHDRLISTLAAMIALTRQGRRAQDRDQIERGQVALEKMIAGAENGLRSDLNGATAGFEMIMPTLVAEAESLGLLPRQSEKILQRLDEERRTKLSLFKGKKISRNLTAAFSAEMAGDDNQHMLDIENLQEANGSVGCSPSATAYFALSVKPGDEAALNYLRNIAGSLGGAPDLLPFDVYEALWVLWNFSLIDDWDYETKSLFRPVLAYLKNGWDPASGIGFSTGYSIPDGDNTCFAFEVLSRFGETPDVEAILAFEERDNFRTYHYEANSSSSVNIHALGALRQAGFKVSSPQIQKILSYLQKTRLRDTYWFDKWNLSPYYTTAHAIIACADFADELILPAVEWMLETQNPNGSWGHQFENAEETAYCIQALEYYRQHGGGATRPASKRAALWLSENSEPPYPPLWIGKGLYTPELVVQSAILSALLISDNG